MDPDPQSAVEVPARPALVLPAGRAALFAAASAAVGAAGHRLATDDPLAAGPLMPALTVLFGAGLWAARRRRGRFFWPAWVLGGQGLLHLLLTPPAPTSPVHAHHRADAVSAPVMAAAHHGGPGMLAAHLATAVLVTLLVHRADGVWWTLSSTTGKAVRRLLAPVRALRLRPPVPAPLRLRSAFKVKVRQLPDAKELAFKTLQSCSDGRVDRWIELPIGGAKPDKPAPVLALKAAAPGATPLAAATPTPVASSPAATASSATSATAAPSSAAAPPQHAAPAKSSDTSSSSTVPITIGVIAVPAAAAGGVLWWRRRRASGTN